MPLLGPVEPMRDIDWREIHCLNNPYQAVRLCLARATPRLTDGEWADYLDVTQGTFNWIINNDRHPDRQRHMPLHWPELIQHRARNRAIAQYFEAESKGQLNRQQPERELTTEEKARLWDEQQRKRA